MGTAAQLGEVLLPRVPSDPPTHPPTQGALVAACVLCVGPTECGRIKESTRSLAGGTHAKKQNGDHSRVREAPGAPWNRAVGRSGDPGTARPGDPSVAARARARARAQGVLVDLGSPPPARRGGRGGEGELECWSTRSTGRGEKGARQGRVPGASARRPPSGLASPPWERGPRGRPPGDTRARARRPRPPTPPPSFPVPAQGRGPRRGRGGGPACRPPRRARDAPGGAAPAPPRRGRGGGTTGRQTLVSRADFQ